MRFDERGQVAGVETIPLGILIFVTGTILAVNVWAAIDTRIAVDAAAHAYLRAYSNAPEVAVARARGGAAARDVLLARGLTSEHVVVTDPPQVFGPCRAAEVVIAVDLPAIRAPFVGTVGSTTVSARQREIVEPYSEAGQDDDAPGIEGSPCA